MVTFRTTLLVFGAGIVIDLLSFVGWSAPASATPIMASVLVVVAIGAFINVRFGVAAVLLELLWGSHGYLFRIPAGGLDISLRMGLFFVVFVATIWHLRQRDARTALWQMLRDHPVRWPALAFLATLMLGLILGLARHSFDLVFFDSNAWAFLALAPAFLFTANASLIPVFTIGALYLIIRTYFLFFAFSHDLGGTWLPLYQWVRDTRLGEVTVFPGAFPRVFLPSMVLLLPAIFIAARQKITVMTAAVFGGGVVVILMSLSRSYWLAGLGLFAVVIIWFAARMWRDEFSQFRTKLRKVLRGVIVLGGIVAVAMVVAIGVVRFPYPKPITTAGVGETLLARLSSDAAVSNRWQQLHPLWEAIRTHFVFGNGFGASVTYETKDPRTLVAFPNGNYTATAFEWGYLDDLLERGFVGLLAELWFLSVLIWRGLRKEFIFLSLGLFALAIVHATSPYLNHPLGIGLLLLLFAMERPGRSVLSSNLGT